jgi:ABC-type phosphate/phosphonate transport system permease subunit
MTVLADERLRLRRPQPGARTALTALLALAFAASLVGLATDGPVWHPGGLRAAGALARSVLAPDLSPAFLLTAAQAALVTVSYAVAGMTVALLVGLPAALALSGVTVARPLPRRLLTGATRLVMGAFRAVHELVWALLFLVILGPVPAAGVLAIGLPYGATIARVIGERLQDVPAAPLEALRSAGATPLQVLCYGRLPLVAADATAYLWYRFECALRAAAVLSFIGLGGLGYRIQIALADLRFGQVWTLVAVLVLVIVAVDRVSGRARRRYAV